MRTLLLIALLLPLHAKAQGLNKVFLLPGALANAIVKLSIENDTIVAYGGVIDSLGKYGVHLSKFDSLGNLLSSARYFHPLGKPCFAYTVSGLCKTSDGGHFAVGGINSGDAIVLLKFSASGELEWAKELKDPALRVMYGFGVVECEGGYLIVGPVQYQNYDVDGRISKVSSSGDLIWRKDYGSLSYRETLGDIRKKGENSFFVSGEQNNRLGLNDPNLLMRPWIFEMDSMGTVLSEWLPDFLESMAGGFIQLEGDDGIVLLTSKAHYFPNPGTRYMEFVLRKLDTGTWQTLWQGSITGGPVSTYFGFMYGLAQNPVDGAWDAVGVFHKKLAGGVRSGMSAHVSSVDGSNIWVRTDTAYLSPLLDNESRLFGIGHLSSGSIVAGGAVLTDEGGDLREEAWLLKIGIDGCTVPGDCAPKVPAREPVRTSALKWLMFPNPATSHTYLVSDREMEGRPCTVSLFDQQGRLVREQVFTVLGGQPVRVSLEGLPPGVYAYRVLTERGEVGAGKVMVGW